jgi:hypothetical protein
MNAACCACVFHSTPQLASPQQGLLAGALYSQDFLSDHLSRIDVQSLFSLRIKPVVPDLAKVALSAALSKRAESHRNKTIAPPVS